jgi:hypothetical protein
MPQLAGTNIAALVGKSGRKMYIFIPSRKGGENDFYSRRA